MEEEDDPLNDEEWMLSSDQERMNGKGMKSKL